MINQELIKYIELQLQLGVSREQINSSLMAAGWNEQDINEAYSFLSESAAQSVTQGETSSFTDSPKKNKKKIVGIIIGIVLFLVLAGGVSGYFFYYLNPTRILGKTVANLQNISSLEYSGELEAKASVEQVLGESTSILAQAPFVDNSNTASLNNILVSFSGKSDTSNLEQPKIQFSFDISSDLLGEAMQIGLEFRFIQQKAYIQIRNMEEFLQFLGLANLNNQWVEIDMKTLQDTADIELSTDVNISEIGDAFADRPEFLKITEKLPTEEIDGVKTFHYAYEIDKDLLIRFVEELSSEGKTDINFSTEDFDDIESIKGEIWIGKKDYYPYKLTLNVMGYDTGQSGDSNQLNFTLFLKNFNQVVQIDVPSNTKTFEEILNEAMSSEFLLQQML
jgi:hypothetical protein